MNLIKIIATVIIFFTFVFSVKSLLNAATTDIVDADVKISLCGDSLAEGPEECDNVDLRGFTCQNLGYAYGFLSCDPSCSLDTIGCVSPTPSITPTVATPTIFLQTPTQTPPFVTPDTRNIPDFNPDISSPSLSTPIQNRLPIFLQKLDLNGDGIISLDEIVGVIGYWLQKWYVVIGKTEVVSTEINECDINLDEECDLRDFSILLYFVEG